MNKFFDVCRILLTVSMIMIAIGMTLYSAFAFLLGSFVLIKAFFGG